MTEKQQPLPAVKWLIIVASLWLAAAGAVLWLDRPLTIYIHEHGYDQWLILRKVTEGLPFVLPLFTFYIILTRSNYSETLPLWLRGMFCAYFYLCLKITLFVKSELKMIFGRYWPKTWINHNLSLIHDGVYGFDWWHGINNQGSFPSGHSVFTAFCCVWFSYLCPRLRYLAYSLMVVMPLALITLDYHYLGDCLAGLGLGIMGAVVFLGCGRLLYLRLLSSIVKK